MAIRVRNLDAAQDELAARDQLMNVVTDANVNHCGTIKFLLAPTKIFRCQSPPLAETKTRVSFGHELFFSRDSKRAFRLSTLRFTMGYKMRTTQFVLRSL